MTTIDTIISEMENAVQSGTVKTGDELKHIMKGSFKNPRTPLEKAVNDYMQPTSSHTFVGLGLGVAAGFLSYGTLIGTYAMNHFLAAAATGVIAYVGYLAGKVFSIMGSSVAKGQILKSRVKSNPTLYNFIHPKEQMEETKNHAPDYKSVSQKELQRVQPS